MILLFDSFQLDFEQVMPDEDREPVSVKKQLAEKLQKLKPQAAPAL